MTRSTAAIPRACLLYDVTKALERTRDVINFEVSIGTWVYVMGNGWENLHRTVRRTLLSGYMYRGPLLKTRKCQIDERRCYGIKEDLQQDSSRRIFDLP